MEKKQNNWNILARFLHYLGVHKGRMVLMYLMNILQVGAAMIIPFLIKGAVDDYIVPGDMQGLKSWAVLMAVILIVQFFSARLQGKLITKIGYDVLFTLRQQIFTRLQSMSLRFFDNRKTGSIMTRITSDVEVLEELVRDGLVSIVVDSLMLVGITLMMVLLDYRLSLILLVILPLFFIMVFYVKERISQTARGIQKNLSGVNSFLNETMSGIKVIRSFAREKINGANFRRLNKDYYLQAKRFYPLVALFWLGVATISTLGTVLVLLGGGILYSRGLITLGVIAAFLSYINRFFQPMQKLSNLLNQISRAMVSCERIFELIDEKPEITDRHDSLSVENLKGEVRFEQLSFAYNPGEPVLEDISFEVKPGEMVAVVGPTGSGKSTIVNLLCRFYDPQKGRITVDGIDLRDMKLQDYRNHTAMVMQDSVIFTGTLMDNIRYGKPEVSLETAEEMARELGIHEMFLSLPSGYDTAMSERGANLSLGQKQLVSFVRALLRDPQILILDEASAYIDTQTEQLVQKAMNRLRDNRTCFVIAHRLSTIKDADKIIVIDQHRIAEVGTHEELLARKGQYADYVKSQFH